MNSYQKKDVTVLPPSTSSAGGGVNAYQLLYELYSRRVTRARHPYCR